MYPQLPYNEIVAKTYADIRFQLEKRGKIIGPLDMLIAAYALSRNAVQQVSVDGKFMIAEISLAHRFGHLK